MLLCQQLNMSSLELLCALIQSVWSVLPQKIWLITLELVFDYTYFHHLFLYYKSYF